MSCGAFCSTFVVQVRELATKVDAYKKRRAPVPLLLAELRKCVAYCEFVLHCFPFALCLARFLPPRCPQHLAVFEGSDGCAVEDTKAAKECSKYLDFAAWLESWQSYTLAAVITNQMTFLGVRFVLASLLLLFGAPPKPPHL